jgi:phenylacetaldehyde dehydrogenase
MTVMRDEIFGPVLVAQSFEDLDDIAGLANDTPFGVGASIWSQDVRTVQRMVPEIRAGTVWVNCHNVVDPNMPFGGFKQSGFGREHGRAVLDLYTEIKSVCMAY